jgi:hypothetical protein
MCHKSSTNVQRLLFLTIAQFREEIVREGTAGIILAFTSNLEQYNIKHKVKFSSMP